MHPAPFPSGRLTAALREVGHVARAQWRGTVFCVLGAVAGAALSAWVYSMLLTAEDLRVRHTLESRVEWRAKDIEHRLGDGTLPLGVMAVAMGSLPDVSEPFFAAVSARAGPLGMPLSRLSWQPRVPASGRAAFEAAVRAAGLPGFQIRDFDAAGNLVPAAPRDEYFPVRFEKRQPAAPGVLGFDIGSTANRRAALAIARDQASPVALSPAIPQPGQPPVQTYNIYWPVYASDIIPPTVPERRRQLTGYVTAVVQIADALRYAVQQPPELIAQIHFEAGDEGSDASDRGFATFLPGAGIVVDDRSAFVAAAGAEVFRRDIDVLTQHWRLTFVFPPDVVAPLRSKAPAIALTLGLLLTASVAALQAFLLWQQVRGRQRETQLAHLTLAQGQLNTELTAANTELARRERAAEGVAHARTRFLASASHDLRQPLHALALFTSALQRRVSDAVALELVGNIQELTVSMQHMFTSLLDLSRLDAAAVEARPQPHDMQAMVARMLVEFSLQAQAKGISLRKAGRFPLIETDPALLESILRNLVGNAIKFTDAGGVLIAGRVRGTTLRIEIWDTGPGIEAAASERIFLEFERVGGTGGRPGFGLGLPIARRLGHLIGAEIEMCSRPGHGSRFSIVLQHGLSRPGSTSPATDRDQGALDGLHVLIVDNDHDVQRAMSLELDDLGCAVTAASDGAEALARLHAGAGPDLVLLDLHFGLAQEDGWEIARALRAVRPDLPIILLTGSTDAATLQRIRDSHIPALFKPVLPERLRVCVQDLMAAREADPG